MTARLQSRCRCPRLTSPPGHLWMHRDGELFWWLAHGIEAPEGGLAMPAFGGTLSDDDRWHLIDYIRAHNAGITVRADGTWSPPVQAPGLQAVCSGGLTVTLADLRGGFVRLVIGSPASVAGPGVTTILATADPATHASAGVCVAGDEAVPQAYAIISGLTLPNLPGTQFLIDGEGWLRAVQRPAGMPGWNDPATLAAEVQQLAAHPIAPNAGASHAHMQM